MKDYLLILLICFLSFGVLAQERTVSGKVTGESDGLPIPGVTVLLKGTTIGTISDVEGSYKLTVPTDGGVIIFSFIGLVSQEIEIGSRSVINVALADEVGQLSEIVITGYGIKREKKELAYQTERVSGEELNAIQQTRAASALAGKVAGLQINIQNNGVDPSTQILLRGLRSISANNSALIVIDGVIADQSAFDDLNPYDIESLNVLKGASAAALYGSRASNGALIVTTKSGSYGESFTIGITSTTTFQEVAYMPDFQTEHGTGWDGAYDNIENTNWGPRFDGQIRQIGPTFADGSFQAVPYAPIKDNLRDFYERGRTLQNTMYISGGDETSKFYLSIGNQDTKGIVPDDTYSRSTFRVNASKKVGKLELTLNSSYFNDKKEVVGSSIGDQNRTFYWFILNTPANIPLTDYKDWDNPESFGYADNYNNAFYQNPYWAIGTNRNMDRTNRLQANFSGSWDIKDNINWTTRVGVNTATGSGKNWRADQTYDPVLQPFHSTVSSFVEDTEFQSSAYNGNSIISGEFQVMDDFSVKSILGASFHSFRYHDSEIRADNLSIPGFYDISNGTGQIQAEKDEEEKRTYGFFADVTLGYRGYVFLNLSGRQDYTSTLPKDNNGYFYPSVGLSFVLSDAVPAISNSGLISYTKITASNSTVYNDLESYALNEVFRQSSGFPFGSINGFFLGGTAVDASIEKEKLNTTEFGLNLGFLKGRVSLDAAYFMTKTTNLITSTTPSVASGAEKFLTNIGELKGTGLELTIGGTVLRTTDFSWNVNVNYTQNETVVEEIKDDLKEIAITTTGERGIYAIVGEAFPQIKAASYERDPQGRVIIDAVSGNPLVGGLKNLGKTTPDYVVGLNTGIKFKGISLSATIDYRTGHVYYAQLADAMEFTGRGQESVASSRQDFVWPNSVIEISDGVFVENNNIPITGGVMGFWQNRYNEIKENYVRDATAFKLRELALNYTFPASILDKIKVINKITIGLVARNLFTWLPEENRFSDPEFNNSGIDANGNDIDPNGIGFGGYFQSPPTRSFGFNLNVEF